MKIKKELSVQIGGGIRDARARAGLTQERLGGLLSLDTKNVSDIERGVVGVKVATLKRICEQLPVSGDELLLGHREKNDAARLSEQLGRLPPEQFVLVEGMLNKILATFAALDAKRFPMP